MSKPDVEKVHDEFFRVYHRGIIFDVNRMVGGWAITRSGIVAPIHCTIDEEDVFAWLKVQAAFPAVPS